MGDTGSHRSGPSRKFGRHSTWTANQTSPQPHTTERQRKFSQSARPTASLSRTHSHLSTLDPHHLDPRLHRSKTKLHSVNSSQNDLEELDLSRSAWGHFEEHIMSIDTDSVQFEVKQTTSKGSVLFKEAMEEEYRLKEAFPKTVGTAMHVNRFKDCISGAILREEEDEGEEDEGIGSESLRNSANNHANHCWNKVKIDLQEQHLENKLAKETTGWNLVHRANFNVNNPVDIRQELYDKYLKHPRKWWLEGLQNYEKYKCFFEDRNDSDNGFMSRRKVLLNGGANGHHQGRLWFKTKSKRPLTCRPDHNESESGGTELNRSRTCMETRS